MCDCMRGYMGSYMSLRKYVRVPVRGSGECMTGIEGTCIGCQPLHAQCALTRDEDAVLRAHRLRVLRLAAAV